MSKEKEVEFYAAKANAWFNTKLEYDKSLLVLSAGAIGLLFTLLTTVGVKTITLLLLFAVAIISFTVSLVAVLTIFNRNAKHLEELIAGKNDNDPILGVLDSISIFSFVLGVILALIIGLTTALNQVTTKESDMPEKQVKNQNNVLVKESFNGASNIALQGNGTHKKSFNGAQNVAPPKQDGGNIGSTEITSSSQSSSGSDSGSDSK